MATLPEGWIERRSGVHRDEYDYPSEPWWLPYPEQPPSFFMSRHDDVPDALRWSEVSDPRTWNT